VRKHQRKILLWQDSTEGCLEDDESRTKADLYSRQEEKETLKKTKVQER
jgi:hypothetical protein